MSYCRFGDDSDVYVFGTYGHNKEEVFECCGCLMMGDMKPFHCKTKNEMVKHLFEHMRNGHKVPTYAIDHLKKEDDNEYELEVENVK